jgi:hypothetical protein
VSAAKVSVDDVATSDIDKPVKSGIPELILVVTAPVVVFLVATWKPFSDLTGPLNVVLAIIILLFLVIEHSL